MLGRDRLLEEGEGGLQVEDAFAQVGEFVVEGPAAVVKGFVCQGLPLFRAVLVLVPLVLQNVQRNKIRACLSYLDLFRQNLPSSHALASRLSDKLVERLVHQFDFIVHSPHRLARLRSQAKRHLHLRRRLLPSRLVWCGCAGAFCDSRGEGADGGGLDGLAEGPGAGGADEGRARGRH